MCRRDGAANPYRTTLAFKRKAESLGVRFIEDATVTGIARNVGAWRVATGAGALAAAVVVNCAGA